MFSYEDAPNMEREKQEQICQQLRMLAEGRHPLTGEELPLTGAFADAAVLRTLTQASHCLRDLLEQETPAPARRAKRERRGKFCITSYQLSGILPLPEATGITAFVSAVEEQMGRDCGRLSPTAITKGLEERGFLLTRTKEDGRKQKVPTKEGEALGIYMEECHGYRGVYEAVLYTPKAQLYILNHLGDLVPGAVMEEDDFTFS